MLTAPQIYENLLAAYGQPRWWSDNPYIVMVQSILVQNTAWTSVEKVTQPLADRLSPEFVQGLEAAELENLIRPCGFCKAKAAAILRLTEWYEKYSCDADSVKAVSLAELRAELLCVKGIGAETADVILVYAFHKPSFVIDAYTRRFMERLGFRFAGDEELRRFFESGLERDYQLYGWLHWLILMNGINHCKKTPICENCEFKTMCDYTKNCRSSADTNQSI